MTGTQDVLRREILQQRVRDQSAQVQLHVEQHVAGAMEDVGEVLGRRHLVAEPERERHFPVAVDTSHHADEHFFGEQRAPVAVPSVDEACDKVPPLHQGEVAPQRHLVEAYKADALLRRHGGDLAP